MTPVARDAATTLKARLRTHPYGRPLYHALRGTYRVLRRARGMLEDAWVGLRFRSGAWQTIRWKGLVITETRHDPYVPMIAFGRTAELERDGAAAGRLIRDPAPVIFDVGANVGVMTLLLSRISGSTVYAFEPVSVVHAALRRNLEQNGRTNVIALSVGLSDEVGVRFIGTPAATQHWRYERRDARKTGLYSVHAQPRTADDRRFGETARFTTLDAFCRERSIDRISYVKIDVEGHEAAVLRGGRDVLARLRPVCQLELNPFALAIARTTPRELLAALEEMRYDLFVFDGRRFSPVSADAFVAAPALQEIYAVPREAAAPVERA